MEKIAGAKLKAFCSHCISKKQSIKQKNNINSYKHQTYRSAWLILAPCFDPRQLAFQTLRQGLTQG